MVKKTVKKAAAKPAAKKTVKKTAVKKAVLKKPAKYIYSFGAGRAEGNGKMKELLGGKGANLYLLLEPRPFLSQNIESRRRGQPQKN